MKKVMFWVAGISGGLLALFAGLYMLLSWEWLESSAITCGTTFYHFAMRLAVGYGMNAIFHNRPEWMGKWFLTTKWEQRIYKALQVKKWKKRMPTFVPETFDLRQNTPEQVLGATCQAELVHEVIVLLSWLPVVAGCWFGAWPVFIITSFLAACYDSIFVIMQRYNRPRLLRLLQKCKLSI